MSSRTLSEPEVYLLKEGLNFSLAPGSVPATEITAKVESAVRPLDTERADTVGSAVNSILKQEQPPTPNITKKQQEALKSQKGDNYITVLSAKKGRASVILDADIYHAKMLAPIDSVPYQLLNKDPTDRLTWKLSEKLLTLKRNGHTSEVVCNNIRPRHKQIYGLPNIHTADTPLRPIVSCVNTFANDLSTFLATILSPLTGISNFTVKNSAHLASTIASKKIQDNEIMVSFVVE